MKNIYLIPTNKPSRLRYNLSSVLVLTKESYKDYSKLDNIHIYITSDEEIKDGWSYDRMMRTVNKIDNVYSSKIILTTDPQLIEDGVQAIDDEFLKWFVKNPSCEYVEVTYDKDIFPYGVDTAKGYGWYKIIIPQEEPKQELHICKYCGAETTQSDDECYAKPKQETLEETGKRVSELVDAMDSNMEMFSITNQIDELGYAVSNMRDIIHEIVKILDVK